uniref:Uncharacterized protein n=1 Tax=Glossina austeni TaxID=7395 RepID=A0A1A9VWQ2_GLOAU
MRYKNELLNDDDKQYFSPYTYTAMPKKKKPKVNLHHRSFSKSCLSTDELAVIIRGPNRRQTLKESELYSTSLISNSINTAVREPILKAKSSLNLNLSTSPSSGIYSGASSYASSLQARSSSSSSSSIESLNSSYCHTPISSNASTPLSLPSGNPVWPLSLGIPHELAVLRTRMWIYPRESSIGRTHGCEKSPCNALSAKNAPGLEQYIFVTVFHTRRLSYRMETKLGMNGTFPN